MNRPIVPGAPTVSVIIPAYNAANTLTRQLDALAAQAYGGTWEVVVVDDGSTDGTGAIARSRRGSVPALHVVELPGPGGPNRARNAGCRNSHGSLLLFCDADDVVAPRWVEAMAGALESAAAVGGALERVSLNNAAAVAARPPKPVQALQDTFGFLPYPQGANCGVRREVWERLGGFDESFTFGSDDVEFFWRVQLLGLELVFVPDAVVHYQLRSTPLRMAKQAYQYGQSHPKLFSAFARHGMPASGLRATCLAWVWLLGHAHHLVRGIEQRATWLTRVSLRLGRLRGSLRHRVVYP